MEGNQSTQKELCYQLGFKLGLGPNSQILLHWVHGRGAEHKLCTAALCGGLSLWIDFISLLVAFTVPYSVQHSISQYFWLSACHTAEIVAIEIVHSRTLTSYYS